MSSIKGWPTVDPHSAAPFVDISPNDGEVSLLRVCRDSGRLVLCRIALKIGGHSNILRRAKSLLGFCQLRIAADDERIDHGSTLRNATPLTSKTWSNGNATATFGPQAALSLCSSPSAPALPAVGGLQRDLALALLRRHVSETDDPRWLRHLRTLHDLHEAEIDAECALASIVPTTTAGVCAHLKYGTEVEELGCAWPGLCENENDRWGRTGTISPTATSWNVLKG